jgi:tape measure domain-containing protein
MEGGDLRMSSSIEERVVSMKFDNAQFEHGIQTTLNSLAALNKGLQLTGATKGLTDLSAAGRNVATSTAGVEAGVQSIADRFKAMSVIAITALSTITHQAITAGSQLVKSLTVDPVKTGLKEYETQLNSIQTVMANTGREGAKGLAQVNAALSELNEYSDQTIYNFGEMAKNIGTFTAAGVSLEVATAAIKGIANLAAISGSNSQQASAAMYQLSQALAAGKVSLEDWNSVVNAGMGGKVFQDSLMETARVHGVAIDKIVKDAGSFRLSLQEGWLTSSILTETLSKFTGDLNAAQLKTMGYNKQQIAEILKLGKVAQDAATKVKTMSQLIGTLQEAAGSGWARTWQLIFGDFEEARTLWTNVNNVLGQFINQSADARNKVIGDWKELGGRTVLIEAIANAFNALMAVIKPIRDAFRQIFPATTGKQLYEMTVAIRDFTEGLKIGSTTATNLQRTFAGVFAILGLGWDILKEVVKTILTLAGVATEGSGGFLEFTANIGDFLVNLRQAIRDGDGLVNVFKAIGAVLAVPIKLIKMLAGFLGSLFEDVDSTKATDAVEKFSRKLEPLGRLGDIIAMAWGKIMGVLGNVMIKFQQLGAWASDFFGEFGQMVISAFQGLDLNDLWAGIATGGFASLVLMLRNIIGGGGLGGIMENVGDAFENLTNALGAMQNTLRAATLLQIAVAVGILAISMNTLAKIDAAGLTRASAAITVMFAQLLAAMLIFEKTSGFVGFAKMPFVAASMILLGVAINVLASAVKELSELDWNELAKGLTGVTVLLAALIGVMKFMPNPAGMISTGAGLVILAAAIKILASAVTDLSGLSWEEMAKGLIGVGALLAALTLFTKFAGANAGGVLQGAGIVLLAVGIKILASAVEDMAGMKWDEIGRGLTVLAGAMAVMTAALMLIPPTAPLAAISVLGVALSLGLIGDALKSMAEMSWGDIGKSLTAMLGALTIIAAALYVIPPTAPLGAAALLIVAMTLQKITDALKSMAEMNWGEIGRAMTVLAGSLLIIATAMNLMIVALPGAAALLVVAASLAILAPILQMFGEMTWGEITKGLLGLAGVFAVLGAAGIILAPLVPVLIGLGIAITLLGIGMLAAGAGVLLFATGLTALSIAGTAGTLAMVAMVSALAALIPMVMAQIGLGIVEFAKVIATAGPAITAAITTVLLSLIDAIVKLSPKIIEALFKLLSMLLDTMVKYVPKMVDAGLKLLTGILKGISNNIGKVVDTATDVIVKFLNALGKNQPKVVDAGVKMIIAYVNGVANAIRNNSAAMGEAGANLASAIVEGMIRGLGAGVGRIASKARDVAKSALSAAMSVLGINSPSKEFHKLGEWSDEGLADGLDEFSGLVGAAATGVGKEALAALRKSISGVGDIVSGGMDINPVITPVLDLTSVRKDASELDGMFRAQPISVDSAYSTAMDTSARYQNNIEAQTEATTQPSHSEQLTFNQYNNSPKALSSADIYRQTKNQLSVAKGALADNNA